MKQPKKPETVMIRTDRLVPNDYNPNRHTPQQVAEHKAEVERLGRIPKPIVVHPGDDGAYVIIDGEHSWNIARELGYEEVPCEVVEVDEFEARMQTFKRNQGGRNDRVKLGRMFRAMMDIQAKRDGARPSCRRFAGAIRIPEATARSRLDYARAADLRTRCAPTTADADITQLTVQQVKLYIELPDTIRDRWLNAGGDVHVFDVSAEYGRDRVLYELNQFGLGDFLDDKNAYRFEQSLAKLVDLCAWLTAHGQLKQVAD